MRYIINLPLCLVLLFTMLGTMTSCEKETTNLSELQGDQLLVGRLAGTWAKPSEIKTPAEVPAEIFGNMRLAFTSDGAGTPLKFLAHDCPIVFSSDEGTWAITGTEDDATVLLEGVEPVDEFKAQISSKGLTLTFYMGWENTETGEIGQGDFSVTLTRQ